MDLGSLFTVSNEKNYALLLKKLENVENVFKKSADEIFQAIQSQNMETHQMIFMFCINFLDVQVHFNVFDRFLKSVRNATQALFKVSMLNNIAEKYKNFMQKQQIGMKAIKALETAARALEAENIGFSKLHVFFVETCLQSKMYKSALRLIDQPLVHLDVKSRISEADFFAFQYYAGCIYLGLKHFSVNTEIFDAFQGQLINFILTIYRQSSKDDLAGFNHFLDSNKQALAEEGNLGLARQMEKKFIIKDLKKLSKTYLRYRVKDLASATKNLGSKNQNISSLQREINKHSRIFKIDRKHDCIEFIAKEEIDHQTQVLIPLKNLFGLLKGVKEEYESENEKMLIERLQSIENV